MFSFVAFVGGLVGIMVNVYMECPIGGPQKKLGHVGLTI